MNKLSKEKQQQLILAVMLTLMGCLGIYMGIIRSQKTRLADKRLLTVDQNDKNTKASRVVRTGPEVEARIADVRKELAVIEAGMASGDLYRWSVSLMNTLLARHPLVEIPGKERPSTNKVTMLADFPYSGAYFTVRGTAHYHDLGKLVADFENSNPYFRLQKMRLLQPATQMEAEAEKVAFELEVAALVAPEGGL